MHDCSTQQGRLAAGLDFVSFALRVCLSSILNHDVGRSKLGTFNDTVRDGVGESDSESIARQTPLCSLFFLQMEFHAL